MTLPFKATFERQDGSRYEISLGLEKAYITEENLTLIAVVDANGLPLLAYKPPKDPDNKP